MNIRFTIEKLQSKQNSTGTQKAVPLRQMRCINLKTIYNTFTNFYFLKRFDKFRHTTPNLNNHANRIIHLVNGTYVTLFLTHHFISYFHF
jgi:hypothetical protein